METGDEFEQGYDEDWVDPVPDVFECAICLFVLNKPIQTTCGHRFCNGCITKVVKDGRPNCPIDNMNLPEDAMFPDNYAKREIMNLRVRCRRNKDCDCPWEGKLMELNNHLKECKFRPRDCPNKCGKQLLQKDMDNHLKESCSKRIATCEDCEIKVVFAKLQEHQEIKCKRRPVRCPNGCGKYIPREELEQHIEGECSASVLQCAMVEYDCAFKGSAEQLRKHWSSIANHHITKLVKENQALRGELRKVQEELEKRAKSEDEKLDLYNGHAPDAGLIERFEEHFRMLDAKLARCFTNIESCQSNAVQLRADLNHEMQKLTAKVNQHDAAINDLSSQIWNGKFIWKINNFEKKFREARSGEIPVIHSQPFYTGIPGYRMCLRVNLNGIDSGAQTHLSMFVHLMQGTFDDILPWPFPGSLVLMVLDQDVHGEPKNIRETLAARPNLQAFNRPKSTRNQKGYGYVEMIPHQILRTNRYLQNDSIFVRVDVTLPPMVLDKLQH